MSLTTLSPAVFALGLAALAGLLYLLQRLRVRHRQVTVVTTLFWREAVEEARARVLVKRFRHPWAYALLVLIAGLVWLAIAGPNASQDGGRAFVLVLDGSARMQGGTRFAEALAAVRERAAELPRGARRVVFAGAFPKTLLAEGEELPLLDERARALAPESAPSSLERTLQALAAVEHRSNAPAASLALEVFAGSSLDPALARCLPEDTRVVQHALATPVARNDGVVALGASPAASGAWDAADVLAVTTAESSPALDFGTAAHGAPESTRGADGMTRTLVPDVLLAGGRVGVRLPGNDGVAADDRAELALPERHVLRVALSPGLAPAAAAALRAVLDADPGLELVETGAELVARRAGEDFGAGRPALELAESGADAPAFVLRRPRAANAEAELRRAFDDLGLSEIDALDLADASARKIEVVLEEAPVRSIAVWAELLEERYDFTRTRAFPLFAGRAFRWLADARALETTTAAGELRLSDVRAFETLPGTGSRSVRYDPVGAEGRLPRVGEYQDEAGAPHHAALLDRATTLGARASAEPAPAALPAESAAAFEPLPWIVLLALVLLLLEWFLVRTERIP